MARAAAQEVREYHPDGTSLLKDPSVAQMKQVKDELLPDVVEKLMRLSDARAEAVLQRCRADGRHTCPRAGPARAPKTAALQTPSAHCKLHLDSIT